MANTTLMQRKMPTITSIVSINNLYVSTHHTLYVWYRLHPCMAFSAPLILHLAPLNKKSSPHPARLNPLSAKIKHTLLPTRLEITKRYPLRRIRRVIAHASLALILKAITYNVINQSSRR